MANNVNYEIEDELIQQGYRYIVGVDEVGKGPGSGPVVAAAVRIPAAYIPTLMGKVNDSKKLSSAKREELYDAITSVCEWEVSAISNKVIDEINILNATKEAIKQTIFRFTDDVGRRGTCCCDFILIDGNMIIDDLEHPYKSIVRGDEKSISIAAASIVAKVSRDRIMILRHKLFPEYNWAKNKGYLTKEHIEAIQEYGVTKHHRLTFNRVKEFANNLNDKYYRE